MEGQKYRQLSHVGCVSLCHDALNYMCVCCLARRDLVWKEGAVLCHCWWPNSRSLKVLL